MNNTEILAKKWNVSGEYVEALLNEVLDDDIGEKIDRVTEEGVYIMDIIVDINHYTRLPISFDAFWDACHTRLNANRRMREAEKIKSSNIVLGEI